MIDLLEVGKIKKTFGAKGLIKIIISPEFKTDFEKCDFLFVDIQGSKVPFFILEKKMDDGIIQIEEITSPEQASKMVNKPVYLEREKLKSLTFNTEISDESHLIGFEVFDNEQKDRVGTISDVQKFPQQFMLILEGKEGQLMIPLANDFIVSLDTDKKQIIMNLPEGLY